jgi:hypothetical protein
MGGGCSTAQAIGRSRGGLTTKIAALGSRSAPISPRPSAYGRDLSCGSGALRAGNDPLYGHGRALSTLGFLQVALVPTTTSIAAC